MKLDWGEADPNHFMGPLHGLTVAVNGADCEVKGIHRAGLRLKPSDGGDVYELGWEQVDSMYVY